MKSEVETLSNEITMLFQQGSLHIFGQKDNKYMFLPDSKLFFEIDDMAYTTFMGIKHGENIERSDFQEVIREWAIIKKQSSKNKISHKKNVKIKIDTIADLQGLEYFLNQLPFEEESVNCNVLFTIGSYTNIDSCIELIKDFNTTYNSILKNKGLIPKIGLRVIYDLVSTINFDSFLQLGIESFNILTNSEVKSPVISNSNHNLMEITGSYNEEKLDRTQKFYINPALIANSNDSKKLKELVAKNTLTYQPLQINHNIFNIYKTYQLLNVKEREESYFYPKQTVQEKSKCATCWAQELCYGMLINNNWLKDDYNCDFVKGCVETTINSINALNNIEFEESLKKKEFHIDKENIWLVNT